MTMWIAHLWLENMVSKTSRLNLRVPDEAIALLEEVSVRNGSTISEVVRDALDRYVEDEGDSWNSGVVKARIPKGTLDAVETLVMAGDATDVPQAINFALNDWVKAKSAYHLEGRDALRMKIDEHLAEKAMKERLKSAQRR